VTLANLIGDDWISIMPKQFDGYCVILEFNLLSMGITSGSTMTSRNVSFTASHTHDSAMDFNKGIKCDPTLFMIFKLDMQWVVWQHSTLAQVCAQDVTVVLT
jgi:hypothetical protein